MSASLKAEEKTAILDKCKEISASLKAAGLRVELDDRDNYTAGWKYNHWELKGESRLMQSHRAYDIVFRRATAH